jgi:IPT/TIG domain-containing protein
LPIRRTAFAVVVSLVALCLLSCSALNPFCNSSRPVPSISTISPTTVPFAQVQATLILTVSGSNFVSSSVIYWNGAALATAVMSPTQLQATITPTQISGAGTAQVSVQTPSNLAGDVGCTSGGESGTLTFTVT